MNKAIKSLDRRKRGTDRTLRYGCTPDQPHFVEDNRQHLSFSMNPLRPTTIDELAPFPLPKQLENLPPQLLADFALLYELVRGFTLLLPQYREAEAKAVEEINQQVGMINEIIVLLEDYDGQSGRISQLLKTMDELYREFLNLETYQFQLLTSNFNQNFTRLKLTKLAAASDKEAVQLVRSHKSADESDLTALLLLFKEKRKQYHVRKEKLNRWEEDRVSGFI